MIFPSVLKAIFFKVCTCMRFYQKWTLGFISILMDSSSPYMSPYLHWCLQCVCWSHVTLQLCRCCLWTDGVHPSGLDVDLCFNPAIHSDWACQSFDLNTYVKINHTEVMLQFNGDVVKPLSADSDLTLAFVESFLFCNPW